MEIGCYEFVIWDACENRKIKEATEHRWA